MCVLIYAYDQAKRSRFPFRNNGNRRCFHRKSRLVLTPWRHPRCFPRSVTITVTRTSFQHRGQRQEGSRDSAEKKTNLWRTTRIASSAKHFYSLLTLALLSFNAKPRGSLIRDLESSGRTGIATTSFSFGVPLEWESVAKQMNWKGFVDSIVGGNESRKPFEAVNQSLLAYRFWKYHKFSPISMAEAVNARNTLPIWRANFCVSHEQNIGWRVCNLTVR